MRSDELITFARRSNRLSRARRASTAESIFGRLAREIRQRFFPRLQLVRVPKEPKPGSARYPTLLVLFASLLWGGPVQAQQGPATIAVASVVQREGVVAEQGFVG